MSIIPRGYHCYLYFGASNGAPIWHAETWRRLRRAIDVVAALHGTPPSLRVNDLAQNGNQYAHPRELSWSPESDGVWLRGTDNEVPKSWFLVDIQGSLPPRSECLSRHRLPDMFFRVHPALELEGSQAAYDQIVIVVVSKRYAARNHTEIDRLLREIHDICGTLLAVYRRRLVWSLNEFEDIDLEDFIYRGMHLTKVPDVGRAKKRWTVWSPAA